MRVYAFMCMLCLKKGGIKFIRMWFTQLISGAKYQVYNEANLLHARKLSMKL